jgi:hypothetical protein
MQTETNIVSSVEHERNHGRVMYFEGQGRIFFSVWRGVEIQAGDRVTLCRSNWPNSGAIDIVIVNGREYNFSEIYNR